ncbi:MAG: heavy metal sensor histidine kinase [Phenylobacterium sp.]|nr:heavy metal sensor histidine kinase [Phenylobacterium sp.]
MVASITGRLTLMFAATAGIVFTLAGLALFLFQSYELHRHQAQELRARYEILETLVAHSDSAKWAGFATKLNSLATTDGRLRYRVESPDPRFRHDGAFPRDANFTTGRDGFGRVTSGQRTYMIVAGTVPAYSDRPPVRLIIAADLAPVKRTRLMLGVAVLIVSIVSVLTVSALGWWIARRGLAPVDRLSRHARNLNPEDLDLRLPDDAMPAELAGMVTAFNDALERLQQAYVRLSAFNADVAHELRTPLSNLIGQTQVALSRPRPAGDLEEVLQSNLEELERLRVIINDMLFLARADQGAVAANLTPISLADATRKSAEFLDVLFEEAGMTLAIEGDAILAVEPSLFGRAITNLLHNAVRHGQRPGRITVRIEDVGPSVAISVRNWGGPIPDNQLARLFDRFYRLDPARENSGESHGLGLAVVKAVALMHGGAVSARCEDGEVVIGFQMRRNHRAEASPPDRSATAAQSDLRLTAAE